MLASTFDIFNILHCAKKSLPHAKFRHTHSAPQTNAMQWIWCQTFGYTINVNRIAETNRIKFNKFNQITFVEQIEY